MVPVAPATGRWVWREGGACRAATGKRLVQRRNEPTPELPPANPRLILPGPSAERGRGCRSAATATQSLKRMAVGRTVAPRVRSAIPECCHRNVTTFGEVHVNETEAPSLKVRGHFAGLFS